MPHGKTGKKRFSPQRRSSAPSETVTAAWNSGSQALASWMLISNLRPRGESLDQRRQRRREGRERARQIGLALRLHDGGRARLANLADAPGQRADGGVGRGVVAVGTALAEPADRHDMQVGEGGPQRDMAARAGVPARSRPRVDQHVASASDLGQPIGVVVGGGQALLVRVQPGEDRALLATAADVHQRRQPPVGIAARRLDLDHLGAEIGEQLPAIGRGRSRPELGDADARQRRLVCLGCGHLTIFAGKRPRRQASAEANPAGPCTKT